MALPDIDVGWRNPGSVVTRDFFPSLATVRKELFPTAVEERIAIEDYRRSLEPQSKLTPVVRESIHKARLWQEETRIIVYIAGALTGVDEATKKRYREVSGLLDSYGLIVDDNGKERQLLRAYVPHLHGTDPVKHPHVTADEVRDIDHLWAVVVGTHHHHHFQV